MRGHIYKTALIMIACMMAFAACRNERIPDIRIFIEFRRRTVSYFCIYPGLFLKEVFPDFRIEERHICFIIFFSAGNAAPEIIMKICKNLVAFDISENYIIYKIAFIFSGALLQHFYKQTPSENINTA